MKINEFRAWDKENEVMVYSDKSFPLSEYRFGIDLIYGEGLTLSKLSDRINVIYEDGEEGFSNDFKKVDADIMQYTGIKDKNGTKIYEGDILNYGTYGNYKVVYNKSSFKIQKVDFLNGNLHLLDDCYLDEIEVVGNIYENSNLLEV